jgi:hypothetical protein
MPKSPRFEVARYNELTLTLQFLYYNTHEKRFITSDSRDDAAQLTLSKARKVCDQCNENIQSTVKYFVVRSNN